ncbi:hypothetical protein M407DRAFT_29843 [Tulasnella calospora MUT 4182]|uniref:Protein kinase domain-containing protein n=1 Tax=Tulasnella calospora MUT 4182 TaxID=1051891 RepID=A0A0C3KGC1_9AGAM|nr:hypothetical protein M407DRAFT_29843 [Tulasnella calospora MUT 4182]
MASGGSGGDGVRTAAEVLWSSRFEFLRDSGYLLRPRYHPDWVPPWTLKPGLDRRDFEESIPITRGSLLDAKRLSDGKTVYLKHISKHSPEVEIGQYFYSPELRDDPRNHCLPLLDVLKQESDPDNVIIVIPWLRRIDSPDPASVRECADLVQQTLEGLAFMHEHKVAHRDCAWGNIMMDGRRLYPAGWHPQHWEVLPDGRSMKGGEPSRTAVGGVRYYFIDFGISSHNEDQVVGFDGQEPAPELSDSVPYDPYKLDVYILGMAYRHFLIERYHGGLDFLLPLIDYMTPLKPSERPSTAEALEKWKIIAKGLSFSVLSQRLQRKHQGTVWSFSRFVKDSGYRIQDFWWTTMTPNRSNRPLP